MQPTFTLGIEEEYQTIDRESRDLRSHIATELLEKGKMRLEERVKAEMHQSVIEVGTRVCKDIGDAQEDLFDLRRNMIRLADEHGLCLVAGATHPFADWRAQEIYPDERYHRVVEDLQLVARSNLIFGLHVHVGIEDREAAIRIMNSMRYFLPHILALSTNSPFCAPIFPIASPTTRSLRTTSTCSSKPTASITPKRSGGTYARIHSSRRLRCASATFPCAPRNPSRLPR